jgi:large subunit ribosomal protein L22
VVDHIRGRSVPEARTILAFTTRAVAVDVEKVLRSAVANAEANHGLNGDDLIITSAVVDEGPTLKRWRARARGRLGRIKKRTCHITITVAEPAVPVQATEEAKPKRSRRKKEATA